MEHASDRIQFVDRTIVWRKQDRALTVAADESHPFIGLVYRHTSETTDTVVDLDGYGRSDIYELAASYTLVVKRMDTVRCYWQGELVGSLAGQC